MMNEQKALAGNFIDYRSGLTVDELARACGVESGWVVHRVRNGILKSDRPGTPDNWRFSSGELVRARKLCRAELDFDPCGDFVALVVDLCEEVRNLKSERQSVTER